MMKAPKPSRTAKMGASHHVRSSLQKEAKLVDESADEPKFPHDPDLRSISYWRVSAGIVNRFAALASALRFRILRKVNVSASLAATRTYRINQHYVYRYLPLVHSEAAREPPRRTFLPSTCRAIYPGGP
jgi:hypothetical protein